MPKAKAAPTSTKTNSSAASEINPTLAATRTQVKARRRPMLIAGGVGLILVAGLASLYIVDQIQTQNTVVAVRTDIPRGQTIKATDLTTTTVGSIPNLSSVPASQISSLVGQSAQVDLKAGALLPNGAVGPEKLPTKGRSIVGISLASGRIMTGTITPGSKLRLVIIPPANGSDSQTGQVYQATMVETSTSTIQGTGQVVNVEVPADEAPTIGTMAAANRVVVIKDSDQ